MSTSIRHGNNIKNTIKLLPIKQSLLILSLDEICGCQLFFRNSVSLLVLTTVPGVLIQVHWQGGGEGGGGVAMQHPRCSDNAQKFCARCLETGRFCDFATVVPRNYSKGTTSVFFKKTRFWKERKIHAKKKLEYTLYFYQGEQSQKTNKTLKWNLQFSIVPVLI